MSEKLISRYRFKMIIFTLIVNNKRYFREIAFNKIIIKTIIYLIIIVIVEFFYKYSLKLI